MQTLEFARLKWTPGRPDTVRYECLACGAAIREASKPAMLAAGEWRPTAVADDPTAIGFHVSALYSPLGWFAWADIAKAAEEAARDPQKQKTFVNTILGESYAERHDAPDWHRVRERQTADVLGVVPAGVLFLTAGVDMQPDRLESYVWGWGRGRRRWLVDVAMCEGAVASDAPWAALSTHVARTWPTADGRHRVPLARVALDTGYAPVRAHTWARAAPPGLVVLVRGASSPGPALVSLPRAVDAVDTAAKVRRRRRGLRVWQVNTHALKVELYGALHLDAAAPGMPTPPGWVSLPAIGDEACRQLVAEALVRRRVRGIEKDEWVKVYQRNEALDCAVYARAAAHLVGLDRFAEEEWRRLEEALDLPPGDPGAPAPAPEAPASSSPPAPAGPPVVPVPGAPAAGVTWRRSEWWRRRR
jgi:phage terminase large subunit GpA-like protein